MKRILIPAVTLISAISVLTRLPRGSGTHAPGTNIDLNTLSNTVLSTNVDLATLSSSVEGLVQGLRAKVADAIQQTIDDQTLGSEGLGKLLKTVNNVEVSLRQVKIGPRIQSVAQRVASMRKRADALLLDPANRELATQLNLQPWLNKLDWEAAQAAILQHNLDQLRASLEELQRWARAWEPLAPEQQLSTVLRQRLTEVLAKDWLPGKAKQAAGVANAAAAMHEPARPLTGETRAYVAAGARRTASTQPPLPIAGPRARSNVRGVIKMLKAGVAEGVIREWIKTRNTPFDPTSEDAEAIREMGLSWPLWAMHARNEQIQAARQDRPPVYYYDP